jgi:ppGpp synthetase/RelA/SpoT-type nucleotidyltranferase
MCSVKIKKQRHIEEIDRLVNSPGQGHIHITNRVKALEYLLDKSEERKEEMSNMVNKEEVCDCCPYATHIS